MNEDIKMIAGGIGALIALYLIIRYGSGFATVVQAGGSVLTSETKTLQGN